MTKARAYAEALALKMAGIAAKIIRCLHKGSKLGYVQWHDWAEKMHKLGYRQHRCKRCGLWAVWRKS